MHGGVRHEDVKLSIDSYQTLARYNRVQVQGGSLSFAETLYNAGAVMAPSERFNVFASYSEGFGMPDVGRVLRSINTPGTSVASLSALQPVLNRNVELGTRLRGDAWDVDVGVFQSRSDYGTRVIAVDGAFQMAREKTRIEGVDAIAKYRLNDRQRLGLAYAYRAGATTATATAAWTRIWKD